MEYLIVKNGFGMWLIENEFEVLDLPVFEVLSSYFVVGFWEVVFLEFTNFQKSGKIEIIQRIFQSFWDDLFSMFLN
ncbi:MAG: hypothetical protein HC803_05865 [Saprospiraceae bacterium]|nr:hypothetical protein [Saprospiraceae bacterium]